MADLNKAARRVSLTLTLGQENAIKNSLAFRLNGNSYSRAIRHWMVDGIMKDQHADLQGKYDAMLREARRK
jgi:hypothetical protein